MRALLLLLHFTSLVAALRGLISKGCLAQVLCDLDQIQVTQTLVVNTSSTSSRSSYLYAAQANTYNKVVGMSHKEKEAEEEEDVTASGSATMANGGANIQQKGGAIFHVKVANNCPCSAAAAITFFCDGFEPGLVRTDVLRVEGARCLLIEGEALLQLSPVRFDYASPHQLPLLLESADFTC